MNRLPNSVETLEPNDRFVEAVNQIPQAFVPVARINRNDALTFRRVVKSGARLFGDKMKERFAPRPIRCAGVILDFDRNPHTVRGIVRDHETDTGHIAGRGASFQTTHWTVVLQARGTESTQDARQDCRTFS